MTGKVRVIATILCTLICFPGCINALVTGKICGYVYDGLSGEPPDSFALVINETQQKVQYLRGPRYFFLNLHPGEYSLSISAPGYCSQDTTGIIVVSNQTTWITFTLFGEHGVITGFICDDSTDQPVREASIEIDTSSVQQGVLTWVNAGHVSSDSTGYYYYITPNLNPVLYRLRVSCYTASTIRDGIRVDVSKKTIVNVDVPCYKAAQDRYYYFQRTGHWK